MTGFRPNPAHTPETARALLDTLDAEIGSTLVGLDKLRDRRRRLLRRLHDEGIAFRCDKCGTETVRVLRRDGRLLCSNCAA